MQRQLAANCSVVLFALVLALTAKGATFYYVDAETGNDANAGTSAQLAWKTIQKVNASQHLLQPGDSILFRAGQLFAGPLLVETSGAEGKRITYGRYGEGDKPEITGFISPTEWKAVENGVWETACPVATAAPQVLTIDGKMYGLGRYPNSDAPNGGYLTVDSHAGKESITDAELAPEPNWTGAEVVIRKHRYIIDRNRITSHAGHTLAYTAASVYHAVDGHGYFIQNDPRTLDAYGEWHFDSTKKVLRVFFGPAGRGNAVVKVASVNTLIAAINRHDLCFTGLRFTGSNHNALSVDNSLRLTVRDCEIRWSGYYAIQGGSVKKFTIEDSRIDDTHNNAISFYTGVSDSTVRRVTINNTGMIAGMGASGDGTYNAISMLAGDNNLMEAFKITNTGYIPVHFGGSHVTVRDGFIDGYASVKDDSGGIYMWTGVTDREADTDRKILNNIILNSKGAMAGALGEAKGFGIYLDDACSNVEVSGNTVAHTSAGIFFHNAHHCRVTANTFYDNAVQILFMHDDIDPAAKAEIRELFIAENTLISKDRDQAVLSASSRTDDFKQFGKFERNVYARPADQNLIVHYTVKNASTQAFDLDGYRTFTGFDAGTQPAAVKLPPPVISNVGPNLAVNGAFTDTINWASCWSSAANNVLKRATGKLDGGALEHAYKTPSSPLNRSLIIARAGALVSGRKYVLRFSMLGSVTSGSVGVRLRQIDSPWAGVTDTQFVKIDNTRNECELIFAANSNQPAVDVEWSFNERDGEIWLDNVTLQEATVTEYDPAIFRFEYNATNEPRTIGLEGQWLDVTGKIYAKEITLAPRASIVLLRQNFHRKN
jgi:parallel beta-helix repeat protein